MDAIEDVKSRLNIEDVVGEYVQLKRSGRNFKGLSPFSSEKSPSFMVSPEKQIWHDFSSGKGGNMFSFVMEMEGLDFRETLELLARKAGVDLEQYRGSRVGSNSKLKERLYEALDLAAKFYQVQFSKNRLAYEYILGKRAFSKETALEWRIGYSPDGGTALIDFLRSRKFSDDEIRGAGLSAQRSYLPGGIGDMFRGRVMIPLQDPQGRVVGFTARLLHDDKDAPKYINTPQTMLYDKSRHVYGLHLAKEAIRKSKFVVLVEGNLDVISSHQAGVRQVVATAGTALTEQNLKALSRFTDDLRLCFDADKAGIAATERAIPIASKIGISLSIISIDSVATKESNSTNDSSSFKDPDELIRQDVSLWTNAIDQNQYALDWLMKRYSSLLDLTTAVGKRQFSDIILPIIRRLDDSVEQDHYMVQLAEKLQVSRQALSMKLQSAKPEPASIQKPMPTPAVLDRQAVEYVRTQDHLMALLLLYPKLRHHASLVQTEMLATDRARLLFLFLIENPVFDGNSNTLSSFDDSAAVATSQKMQSLQDYAKILVLQYEELYGDVEDLELDYEITRLQARLIEQYIKTEKQTLTAQLTSDGADEALTRQILMRVRELDTLRNNSSIKM